MVWIVVLLMTCSLSSVRLAHIQEKDFGEILRPASKIWHNKCILITGTTEEQIKELQQGKFTGNENIKKYVLCLGLISDMITTDITVDEKKVKYFVPDNLQYKLPHYIDCLSAAKISEIPDILSKEKYGLSNIESKKLPGN
ncbi:uncharacterized protein isoform X2 [Leptinotarsa decemlineata]|uniref:uncharacterized protein isoform X2 n=1 Tax=Leptinotarsa decemlineata TaxID=7539 RepID=UPI003D3040EE